MPVRHDQTGRSKGERFVKLPLFMLNSAAWCSLTPAARAIYIELAKVYNGRNNGWLALSVRDAADRCRISKDTAAKAFVHLQATGFIELMTLGSFNRKDPHASEWRLAVERCDKTSAPPLKAFMRWTRPAEPKFKTRSQSSAVAVPSNGTVTPFLKRKGG